MTMRKQHFDAEQTANFYAEFLRDSAPMSASDKVNYADAVNKSSLAKAVAKLWGENSFAWDTLAFDEPSYLAIDVYGERAVERYVRVSDVFGLKDSKDGRKKALPAILFAMAEHFGANITREYMSVRPECTAQLKVYADFTDAPKAFYEGENRSSVNALEKQMQILFDTLFGADAVKAKKVYVRHLSDCFVKANRNGYKTGNAIRMMQYVVDHAYDAKFDVKYDIKSGLEMHKAPKDGAPLNK